MPEAFTLELQDAQEPTRDGDSLCEEGNHKPNPFWEWRCVRCSCLLCVTCSEEIDRCRCPKGGRHG